jgi:hypothetical protein
MARTDHRVEKGVSTIGKITKIGTLAVVAFFGLVVGKWSYTAAIEPIDPQRGIYGMDGLEIWIDINARMPAFAREWGCDTLRGREKAAFGGQNSLAPYGCQPGFGTMEDKTAYQAAAVANLAQAINGLDATKAAAVTACFETKMAAAITPEEVQGMNDFDQAVMSKVIIAISETAQTCKAEAS